MSTAIASEYVRKMVERETSGNGDVENAVRRLARRHNLSFWQLMHLRAGRAKSVTIDAFTQIRRAYLEYCEAEIRALQEESNRIGIGTRTMTIFSIWKTKLKRWWKKSGWRRKG